MVSVNKEQLKIYKLPDGAEMFSPYRYAYQGQEIDPETGKEAFQLRLWDARIGRWLTTDPAGQHASPYMGMGNNPITRVDPDGGTDCPDPPCNNSNPLGNLGTTSFSPDLDGIGDGNDGFNIVGNEVNLGTLGRNSFEFSYNDMRGGLSMFGFATVMSGEYLNSFSKLDFLTHIVPVNERGIRNVLVYDKIAINQISTLKTFNKWGGKFATGASVLMDGNDFLNDDIGLGRLGYRTTGNAAGLVAGSAYGGVIGFLAAGAFQVGESYHDAVISHRASNLEALNSQVHIDKHGNTYQNKQNLSFESLDYHFGSDW